MTAALLLRPKTVPNRPIEPAPDVRFDRLLDDDEDLIVVLVAIAERHAWRTHER